MKLINLRKSIGVFLAGLLCFSNFSSFAVNIETNLNGGDHTFDQFLEKFFSEIQHKSANDIITVYDKQNNNITTKFYQDMALAYGNGEVDLVMDYYYENVGQIEQIVTGRAQSTKWIYKPGGQMYLLPQTDMSRYVGESGQVVDWHLKINYNLKSSVVYDIATNLISSASSPTLDGAIRFQHYLGTVASGSIGQYKYVYFDNQAGNASVTADKRVATFTFGFNIRVAYSVLNSDDFIDNIDFGRHQYSFSSGL